MVKVTPLSWHWAIIQRPLLHRNPSETNQPTLIVRGDRVETGQYEIIQTTHDTQKYHTSSAAVKYRGQH